ncbi:MAG: DNA translocase FtsK [Tannerella sp.]|jgi:S-DNA-T family DNA segregation ATPase FtsK/SpoIIIE|nr:DNA translocase FtsK [Tannerella sp.]
MAKKSTKRKHSGNGRDNNWQEWLGTFFTSERVRFLAGLLLCCLVIYTVTALLSFFFTGEDDQSAIENLSIGNLLAGNSQVSNWAGVRGAYIADLLMNRCFGISSFFILFYLGAAGVKWMGISRLSLLKCFLLCTAMLLWTSLFLSFCFTGKDSFLIPGGRQGVYLTEMLIRNIGKPGVILLLPVSFLVIAICVSAKVIPLLRSFFSFEWIERRWERPKPKPRKRPEPKGREDDEEEDEEEDDVDEKEEKRDGDSNDSDAGNKDGTGSDDDIPFIIHIPDDKEDDVPSEGDVPPPPEPPALPRPPGMDDDDDPYDKLSSLGEYDPRLDLSSYCFPKLDLLKIYDQAQVFDNDEQNSNKKRIKQTLEEFGIHIVSINATVGPTLTLYEVVPAVGVPIRKIRNLEDDIALRLSALGIRIIAPMPGKGTIGIEVPNKDAQIVSMQPLIASRKFSESKFDLPIVLGRTITNDVFMFDLCKAPHLLMAGATGQGKSVGLNAIITSLLYKKHPSEMKLVLVDPKMVEFSIYSKIECHYLAKLPDEDKAIITDCTRVVNTLNSLCKEMDDRYKLLTKAYVRNIREYNEKFVRRRLNPEKGHRYMPYIVVVIDEFGDLIMQAGKEIEMPIARIAQKARAIGIHMIIATQRPSTSIITGNIKANFPTRVAFRVSQMVDSRTILDQPGANKLIGRGDLLFSGGSIDMTRVQCAFVDTPEVENIASFIGRQTGYGSAYELPEYVPEGGQSAGDIDLGDHDPMFEDAARLIVIQQQGSTSLIQRKLSLGYNRAGRLMDQLERAGIVGPAEGSKARQVLIPDEYTLELKLAALK